MVDVVSASDASRITAYLDAEAPPKGPAAHIIFGTNQPKPAELVARRYHDGLAPHIILTGGINRHSRLVEAAEHHRILLELGVPPDVIRFEAASTSTQENVEFALPFLHEALDAGLVVTAVCKWYHRRAIQLLRAVLPEALLFHAVTWEPTYDNVPLMKANWWHCPNEIARRVLYEWEVIPKRLAGGSLVEVELTEGAWR